MLQAEVIFLAYILHFSLLVAAFWRTGRRAVLLVLSGAMLANWSASAMLSGPDEVVGFIVISYIALIANEASRHSVRDRPVSLICLVSIACSVFYAAGGLMTYWVYVAVLNCALAMQILVAGGMIDFLARRFDDWLCRVWPWGSRAVRFLAA